MPATTAAEPEVVEVRRGMFGQQDTGDTSGYDGLVRTIAMPAPAERPFGGEFDAVADALDRRPGAGRLDVRRGRREDGRRPRRDHVLRAPRAICSTTCRVAAGRPRPAVRAALGGQRRALPRRTPAASCTPSTTCSRSRTTAACGSRSPRPDADPHIPSVVEVYPTADWHERETWDFFGIVFDGHPALTRIEMPDDWPGHPQRKDYPLGGIDVEYKGAVIPPPDTRRSYN